MSEKNEHTLASADLAGAAALARPNMATPLHRGMRISVYRKKITDTIRMHLE
jgi:hypothetical protein